MSTGPGWRLRLAPAFWLALVLASTAALWWPSAHLLHIEGDDRQILAVSHDLAAGRWDRLLAPHEVHIIPLFRLLRLYFDTHFPERFHWLHAVALLAHSISTVLLYLLSRSFLRSRWSALAAACLFAWHALGGEAILIKSQNTFVVSLPFLLGALWLLQSPRMDRIAGAFGCLLVAVGLHSMLAALAIPGVLLGAYLLAGPLGGAGRAAWLAPFQLFAPRELGRAEHCPPPSHEPRLGVQVGTALAAGVPFALAVALWLQSGASLPASGHHPELAGSPREVVSRGLEGLQGTLLHLSFLARRAPPESWAQAAAVLGLIVWMVVLRKQKSWRWIAVALAITAVPAFGVFFGRGPLGYHVSRYCYQSFLLVAVVAASAVDAVLTALESRPGLRSAVLVALVCAAPWYYSSQKKSLALQAEVLRLRGTMSREAWIGWKSFFEGLPAHPLSSPEAFRLAYVQIGPMSHTGEVFSACYPAGKPGVVALSAGQTHAQDCLNLWTALREVKKKSSPLDRAPLPGSLAILTPHEPVPAGDPLVCRVAARIGEPALLPLGPGP